MDWGVKFLGELNRIKERMDQTWSDLFEENVEEEKRTRPSPAHPVERLPKFEGTGRRTPRPRSHKKVRSYE